MSNNLDELKETEKSGNGRNGSVVMAVVFIVVGVGLIVSNIIGFSFVNWWVLFMLIPVAFFAQNIYRDYRANGRLTQQSTGSIIAGLAISLAAATFLFEAITWSAIWPIGLIFAGIAMFLGNRS
jgi:hypothetical protein